MSHYSICKICESMHTSGNHRFGSSDVNVKVRVDAAKCPADEEPLTLPLTDREEEVLVLVASGYSRKEIGRALAISEYTAATHVKNIYRKLGISCIADAVKLAFRYGVL